MIGMDILNQSTTNVLLREISGADQLSKNFYLTCQHQRDDNNLKTFFYIK